MGIFNGVSNQELQERVWKFEDFQQYFQKEKKKWGHSPQFKAVISAMKTYQGLRTKEITQKSAVKIVNASDALVKACNEYIEYKSEQKRELSETEHRRVIITNQLLQFQEQMNFSEVRDPRKVQELAGKTWDGAMPFTPRQVTVDITGKAMGAAVSQRFQIEVDGKKGFFTKTNVLQVGTDHHFKELLNRTKDPREREKFENNKNIYDAMTENANNAPKGDFISDEKQKWWLSFRYGVKEKRDNFSADDAVRQGLTEILTYYPFFSGYYDKVKDVFNENERKKIFEEHVREQEGKTLPPKYADYIQNEKGVADILLNIREPEKTNRLSEYQMMYAKEFMLDEKNNLADREKELLTNQGKADKKILEELSRIEKRRSQIDALIQDNRAVHAFCQAGYQKMAEETGVSAGMFDDKKDVELTSRNIATTRIAELIGAADVVARSEKIVVKSGNQELTGCFMEFAKGVDSSSKNPKDIEMLNQVEFKPNPSLNQSMMKLEILDFLCAQTDRHGGNMFYQLSEPDEHGKRNIIGLHGIDNDLAFGDSEEEVTNNQGFLEESIFFIDQDMAAKIRNLKNEDLDYALSDVLTENQLRLTKERLNKLQKHLKKNMVEIEPDGWDLQKYSNTPESQLDEQGKKYVKGLKNLEDAFNNDYSRDHKYAYIKAVLKKGREEYVKQDEQASNMAKDMAVMFGEEELEKEAKEPEKEIKEPEGEAKEPEKQAQEAEKEAFPPPQRRKSSFQNLQKKAAEEKEERGKENQEKASQEKKEEQPHRICTNFLSMSGSNAPQKHTPATAGSQEKQAERQKQNGRAMG